MTVAITKSNDILSVVFILNILIKNGQFQRGIIKTKTDEEIGSLLRKAAKWAGSNNKNGEFQDPKQRLRQIKQDGHPPPAGAHLVFIPKSCLAVCGSSFFLR
jgi:hypothetical protein